MDNITVLVVHVSFWMLTHWKVLCVRCLV